jgi:serine protease inhibitor
MDKCTMCHRNLQSGVDIYVRNPTTNTNLCLACVVSRTYTATVKGPFQLVDTPSGTPKTPIPVINPGKPVPVTPVVFATPIRVIPMTQPPVVYGQNLPTNVLKIPTVKTITRQSLTDRDLEAYDSYLMRFLSTFSVDPETNMAVSPLSLAVVLAMIGAISDVNGMAVRQLQTLFVGLQGTFKDFGSKLIYEAEKNSDSLSLSQAASIISDQPGMKLSVAATEIIRNEFNGELFLNATPASINKWASDHTQGKISQILPPDFKPDGAGALVLLNALFFKGKWGKAFDSHNTREKPWKFYYDDPDSTVQCDMMYQGIYCQYIDSGTMVLGTETPTWQSVVLPYKGTSLAVVITLHNDRASTLAENYVEYVKAGPNIRSTLLQDQKREVDLWLPKFKFSLIGMDLNPILKTIGLTDMYKLGTGVAKGALTPDIASHVSEVLQSVFIEVDESGTTAAAVTAAVVTLTMAMPPQQPVKVIEVNCDHPFMFDIIDTQNGMVYFSTVINNPIAQ